MTDAQQRRADLNRWLRTGRWVPAQLADSRLEVKFNPYHDPANGQFTFAPGGIGRAAAADPRQSRSPASGRGRLPNDPKHPRNFGIYTVQAGDTLEHIAATRVGLTPADLRWLNDLPGDMIRVGQRLRVPHQVFLDEGKRAFDTYVALRTYMERHGGALPPDVAHPPTLEEQAFGPGTHVQRRNGYEFVVVGQGRTREVKGIITLAPSQKRSRTSQRNAGGEDRLSTDHVGHYIARRFNGPTEAFNHFAQDAHFNQSGYASIEHAWEISSKAGELVHVTIVPSYLGKSERPSYLFVTWTVGGRTRQRKFPNARGDGK